MFKNDEFYKYNYKYACAVINKLIEYKEIRLGKEGKDGVVSIAENDNVTIDALKSLLTQIKEGDSTLVDDFNNIVKNIMIVRGNKVQQHMPLKWTYIFKGDFSGNADGLKSSNRGNAFEGTFLETIKTDDVAQETLKKMCGNNCEDLFVKEPTNDGYMNNKRPIVLNDNGLICKPCTSENYNIGEIVSDITLHTDVGDRYLSLKYGNMVTLANLGIKRYIPNNFFTDELYELSDIGKMLLNTFCIDEKRFKDVFTKYDVKNKVSRSSVREDVDVTTKLNSNKKFEQFVKSIIGCGYIMVHKYGNGATEYIDLQSADKLDKYLGDIVSAKIRYPINGDAKRVDIKIAYPGIFFNFNFRPKNGGIYPTHLMADYKFLK